MNARALVVAVTFSLWIPGPASAGEASRSLQRVVLPADVSPIQYDVTVTPDAANLRFSAHLTVQVAVAKATSRIVLNAVDLAIDSVALSGSTEQPAIVSDPSRGEVDFIFKRAIQPGERSLSVNYRGTINTSAAGFFALDYTGPGGAERALFTQFENADARRFLPCWDEPARKAIFHLRVVVSSAQTAVSNMPEEKAVVQANGSKVVSFAATPRMSSYLLFLALGDFERVSRIVDGTDIGVVVRRGESARAAFALDAMAKLLPYYNEYFGVKFPLPKLDFIAGPGSSPFFGAMENWGAMFGFEKEFLVDSQSTAEDRHRAFATVAHEMGHQWFGDLVTMAWWDDLWLNEGFTDWLEGRATAHFHPEWGTPLARANERNGAMAIDARFGTHPIVQPIRDVMQANGAFDGISYNKSSAVITMLEAYVGETAFRDGVRAYVRAHAYGNTVSDDLLNALDGAAGQPVTIIAHDFLLQAGIPLLRVDTTPDGFSLTQSRFALDETGKIPGSWHLPITFRDLNEELTQRLTIEAGKPVVLNTAGAGLIFNPGQSGYFRTLYDTQAFDRVSHDFSRLDPLDQLGLLNDAYALGYGGQQPMSRLLSLVNRLPMTASPEVWESVVVDLASLDTGHDQGSERTAFRAYVIRKLAPLVATVGWNARSGESAAVTALRGRLLHAMSQFDDPQVVAGARGRFAPSAPKLDALGPETRAIVLDIVAEHANLDTWVKLRDLARGAPSSSATREFDLLLATAGDPELARRALNFALDPSTDRTTGPAMIRRVSDRNPQLAFDFTLAHLDEVNSRLDPSSQVQFVPRLLGTTHDRALAEKLRIFAASHIPASGRAALDQKLGAVAARARMHDDRLPEVAQWISNETAAQP